MKIDEINVQGIVKEFGRTPRIFQSEAQFQFELAWELQKQIENDGQVLLEVVTCTRKENREKNIRRKRFYSDIILKSNDNCFIVIELKYKTKKDDIYGVELNTHGAPDEGRYDYLWDIKRIELLKKRDMDCYDYNDELGTFLGGYAIIVTNENQYWNRTKKKAQKDAAQTVDSQFSIGEGDTVSGVLDWNTSSKKQWMLSRPAIVLDGDYLFNWQSYYDTKEETSRRISREFKYLITKIEA